jgi:hypothetical protein
MKNIKKSILFTAILVLSKTSVFARDYGQHNGLSLHLGGQHSGLSLNYSSPKKHQSKHYAPVYKPRSKVHYQHNHRQQLGYGDNKKVKKHYYQQPRYSNRNHYSSYNNVKQSNRHYRQSKQSCHPVTKIVTNHYGHSKNIGGTMCYDHHGNGYIVKGSRYKLY